MGRDPPCPSHYPIRSPTIPNMTIAHFSITVGCEANRITSIRLAGCPDIIANLEALPGAIRQRLADDGLLPADGLVEVPRTGGGGGIGVMLFMPASGKRAKASGLPEAVDGTG